MTNLTIIVAVDAQRGIGVNNTLPWRLPEDMAHFKRITSGHIVIMGRKTFDSIGRALPNRRNIVITRNLEWRHEGVETVPSLAAAIALLDGQAGFIIGGAQIYAEAIFVADCVIMTEIDHSFACDAFFPALDMNIWQQSERQEYHSIANDFNYAFVTLRRTGAAVPAPQPA